MVVVAAVVRSVMDRSYPTPSADDLAVHENPSGVGGGRDEVTSGASAPRPVVVPVVRSTDQ